MTNPIKATKNEIALRRVIERQAMENIQLKHELELLVLENESLNKIIEEKNKKANKE